MSKKKTIEEFKNDVYKVHGDNVVVLGEYEGNKVKTLIKYNDCGHKEMKSPSKILAGQGCAKCKGKRISKSKLNNVEDIKKRLANHNLKLIGEYNGLTSKSRVKNLLCGHTYNVNIGNAVNGSGCPICHGFKDTGKFKRQLIEKYGNEYEVLGDYINNRTKIKVKHNKCGHVWEVIPKDLLRDKRCPNCIKSKGEAFISELLENMDIPYESQFKFNECRNILPLPFDFMVKIDGKVKLIEFDGNQHFRQGNAWGDKCNFDKIVTNDNIKNKFCIDNNIPLLRIPYWWIRNDKAERELKKFLFNL